MQTSAPTYAVKCSDCKTTVRVTTDIRESYAGARCESCRAGRS